MSKQSAEEAFEIGLFLSIFSESVKKAFPDLSDEQRMTYAVQVWQYQATIKSNYELMSLKIKLEFDKDPTSFNN